MSYSPDGSDAVAPPTDSITPAQLRWIAEAADGLRHKKQVVVRRADGTLRVTADVAGVSANETIVLHIAAVPEGQKDPDNFSLIMKLPNSEENLRQKYDSLFWSVSALRKFALPYYMAYDETGEMCRGLLTQFKEDDSLVAIAHSPTSDPEEISAGVTTTDRAPFPGLHALGVKHGKIKSLGPVGRLL